MKRVNLYMEMTEGETLLLGQDCGNTQSAMWNTLRKVRDNRERDGIGDGYKILVTGEGVPYKAIILRRNSKGHLEFRKDPDVKVFDVFALR